MKIGEYVCHSEIKLLLRVATLKHKRGRKILTTIITAMVVIMTFYGCQKCHDLGNPACENYDPCYGKQLTTASFKIIEYCSTCYYNTNPRWQNYESDTNQGHTVQFKAQLDNAIYEWHIGTEIYNSQLVELTFDNVPDNSVIPITLIVKRVPNLTCFPSDKANDTLMKSMVIRRNESIVFGTWQGVYSDSPTVVRIIRIYKNIFGFDSVPYINNIYPYYDTSVATLHTSGLILRKEIYFEVGTGIFPNLNGLALVDSTDNNINLTYWWGSKKYDSILKDYIKIFKTFKGKRI